MLSQQFDRTSANRRLWTSLVSSAVEKLFENYLEWTRLPTISCSKMIKCKKHFLLKCEIPTFVEIKSSPCLSFIMFPFKYVDCCARDTSMPLLSHNQFYINIDSIRTHSFQIFTSAAFLFMRSRSLIRNPRFLLRRHELKKQSENWSGPHRELLLTVLWYAWSCGTFK